MVLTNTDAFIVIDVQNDFCPGGALAVPGGDKVVKPINNLAQHFSVVIQTQDWHIAGHFSFASSHPNKNPLDTIEADYGTQLLWPDHCVQGSSGAEFHPGLNLAKTQLILRKGFNPKLDSYSAFYENDGSTSTGLNGYLSEWGIRRIFLAGLATDFCVHWSAVDGSKLGYDLFVIEDACRAIDANGSLAAAWSKMEDSGVKRISSKEILG